MNKLIKIPIKTDDIWHSIAVIAERVSCDLKNPWTYCAIYVDGKRYHRVRFNASNGNGGKEGVMITARTEEELGYKLKEWCRKDCERYRVKK
jgi:hypothetical protein